MLYTYGRYLAAENDKLFYEEIQAWKNGPAILKLYSAIKYKKIEDTNFRIDLNQTLDTKYKPYIYQAKMRSIENTWNEFVNQSGIDDCF